MPKLSSILKLFIVSAICFSLLNVAYADDAPLKKVSFEVPERVSEPEVDCSVGYIPNQEYTAQLVTFRRKLKMETMEEAEWKFFVKNTGNIPWFSTDSGCKNFNVELVSDKEYERTNEFYDEGLDGWSSDHSIKMQQKRVNPGEIALFTADVVAPSEDDVLKEYFVPVIKDVAKMETAGFSFDVVVGEPDLSASDIRQMMAFSFESGTVTDIDLDDPRVVVLDRATQTEYLIKGDKVIKSYLVSTGLYDTPTPLGIAKISCKQNIRIGGKYPHWIMPGFMCLSYTYSDVIHDVNADRYSFTGYGLHATPVKGHAAMRAVIRGYLAKGEPVPVSVYAQDQFRFDAIMQIGKPASHGCVRHLTEDMDFLHQFVGVGDYVVVGSNIEDPVAYAKAKLPALY